MVKRDFEDVVKGLLNTLWWKDFYWILQWTQSNQTSPSKQKTFVGCGQREM